MSYIIRKDDLMHYGTPRHSGRYPYGSGKDPYQNLRDFKDQVTAARRKGLSDAQIAKEHGFGSSTELRDYIGIFDAKRVSMEVSRVKSYADRGWSIKAISEKTGLSESTVRNRLKPESDRKAKKLQDTVSTLKAQVDEKKYLDVSRGTEAAMGVSELVKQKAIRYLKTDGYETHIIKEAQAAGNQTSTMVLVPPGVTWKEAYTNRLKISPFSGSVEDNIVTPNGWVKPLAIDPKRVQVNYGDQTGAQSDGVIFVRPGVKDLDMGANRFAQARIQVGDRHYLKGIAVVKDDLPDGVDLVFNTNKPSSAGKLGVMKKLKTVDGQPDSPVDYDNPFGSVIRRQIKTADGSKAASAINIVNEEGNWDTWNNNLSKQFLSKQSIPLIRSQLELSKNNRKADFDEIMSIENPTIRKSLLAKYSESADSAAEHLKAAALPRQKTHVILPVNTLKDNEVFAPNFKNGERIALVRYPHAGTFEIPELIVNNKNKLGEKIVGLDSVVGMGINHKVAERLSGADFDGDTVVAIPNNSGRVKSSKPLQGLIGFDAKVTYGPPSDFDADAVSQGKQKPPYKLMTKHGTGLEMGKVSNLITDMQIHGASADELARATRHSQVVIDAEKHSLDYKRSEMDNDIDGLRRKYQPKPNGGYGGAATLISKSSSEQRVLDRKERGYKDGGPIDPVTGEKRYTLTGKNKMKKNKDGEYVESDEPLKIKSTKMREAKDAHSLSSGSAVETVYADYANEMKALANRSRKEYINTPNMQTNKEAKVKYKKEVEELEASLRKAEANAPRERQAQRLANTMVKQKLDDNPHLSSPDFKDDLRKVKATALDTARERVGAKKDKVYFTDRQWEAIENGAVSHTQLSNLLKNADDKRVRELAVPRARGKLNPSQVALAKSMKASGYTNAEIAERLGVSTSTVSENMK